MAESKPPRANNTWSEAKCAGYALAGLIAGDRALSAAQAIPVAEAARTRARIAHGGGPDTPRDKQARRQLVEGLLAAVRPELALEHVPLRLRALLATRLPRSQARALGLPTPRAGFVAPEDLWPRLYRIARYYRGIE
ncbi:MAG TPA: hypothetical protein VFX59_02080 [Polyangiales bacterium]|nr:hypothetical protein [Polyangiales bacterium]